MRNASRSLRGGETGIADELDHDGKQTHDQYTSTFLFMMSP